MYYIYIMKKHFYLFLFLVGLLFSSCSGPGVSFQPEKKNDLRAPAYPLITIDPYTSAWSFSDHLYDDCVRHWTGKKHPLIGAVRVDGKAYRFMGKEDMALKAILPTAAREKWDAAYTEREPASGWLSMDFNDASWTKGKAAFGTSEMPNLSTSWISPDIWIRRTFDLPEDDYNGQTIFLEYSHDDVFELYVNGIEVVNTGNTWKNNVIIELPAEVKATLKPGKNIITAHCHNTVGGAYVDFGLYRKEDRGSSFDLVARQTSANVLPTQTYYTFECGPVQLDMIFTSPLLLNDLDLMTTPVNYISYQVQSLDGKEHDVQLYVEATPHWAVDNEGQPVSYEREERDGITYLKTGTIEQPVLAKKGDDVRIDWGYFYMAANDAENTSLAIGDYHKMKSDFIKVGELSANTFNPDMAPESEDMNVLAFNRNLGHVVSPVGGYVMLGYDDGYAIQYFKDNRMAYWKHDGQVNIYNAFEKAGKDYASVMKRCAGFDTRMMNDAENAGGKKYADLCALAYRQAIAAHKLIQDKEGNLLFFSKENFSNGSIGTVDITYPSAPLFLLYNPELLKGMMNPIFYYSESGKWNKPFAAHDVGTYPLANGQTYGGDMPVEESGNMLILTTAIAVREGNAGYAKKHWDVLTVWVNYLMKEGLDPENQLCTDDFAGHFAHNTNLSIKAIIGIAGYGKLAEMLGEKEVADKYTNAAREMAKKWVNMADDGDHYRLTFDQPGTWSQKYNLVWDKLLGLHVFPEEIATEEMAYYLTKQNKYGLPLDIRKTYTKSDWILWTACLTNNMDDFNSLVDPVYKYANETTTRMPLSDWHETTDGNSVGFRARSVVGGYFMKMLEQAMAKDISSM